MSIQINNDSTPCWSNLGKRGEQYREICRLEEQERQDRINNKYTPELLSKWRTISNDLVGRQLMLKNLGESSRMLRESKAKIEKKECEIVENLSFPTNPFNLSDSEYNKMMVNLTEASKIFREAKSKAESQVNVICDYVSFPVIQLGVLAAFVGESFAEQSTEVRENIVHMTQDLFSSAKDKLGIPQIGSSTWVNVLEEKERVRREHEKVDPLWNARMHRVQDEFLTKVRTAS